MNGIGAEDLGSAAFRSAYGLRYAYLAGSMYRGIASADLVIAMARAGFAGFFGAGGLSPGRVDEAITRIRAALPPDATFGVNLLHDMDDPAGEDRLVDLCLARDVRFIEASAFIRPSRALVRYRVGGLTQDRAGAPLPARHLLAKTSHPEIARAFMAPPPEDLLRDLAGAGAITAREAELARHVPLADAVCAEADSGGHTDRRNPLVLFPAMVALRAEAMREHRYAAPIALGAAGGIGTPEAAAAAFMMGADFLLTGSINQCTVESGASPEMKALLQEMDVHDTAYAPAGDMFEIGAQVQVLKRGVLFPARATRLFEIYRRFGSWDEIDAPTRDMLERRYFGRPMADVWAETEAFHRLHRPDRLARCVDNPKAKLALILKWYFVHSTRQAMGGTADRANYQIHCGPALGAFNRSVAGTALWDWRARHAPDLARMIMTGAARILTGRLQGLANVATSPGISSSALPS